MRKSQLKFAAFCYCFFVFWNPSFAQLVNNGVQITVNSGTTISVNGFNVQNLSGGAITNNGTVITSNDIINGASSTMSGNGIWQLSGNWSNSGTFSTGTSIVKFTGNTASSVQAGGSLFYALHLNKTANDLTLLSNLTVNNEVSFLANNNKITCGNFDFNININGFITGADADNFFVTGGTGKLKRLNLGATAFTFPVGADGTTYNPLTITENGTADDIGVRCMAAPLANGSSGSPLTADMTNVAWDITETSAGGSNMAITAQWNVSDELGGFIRTDCGLARFNSGTDWDLPPANMGASTGMGPYNRVRTGLTPGIVTVADEAFMNRVKVALRIMLQGNYNTSTMKMTDNLRNLSLIPANPPATYGALKFVHFGWQPTGGYSIAPGVLAVTGDDAIVDWIFVWLKNPASPSTSLQSRVALLQRDGDVVDLDGVSPLLLPSSAGNYIIAVGHRNHLSVRTPNGPGITLNESTVTSYDFTTAMAQAFGTNPMKEVQTSPTSIFALWGGNANANTTVRATGPASVNDYSSMLSALPTPTSVLSNVYLNADINLDGTLRVTGPPAINDYSKLLSILGISSTIITEQQ